MLTELNCALHAHVLLRRDVDYIVRDGRIGVVDEFTGRVVADRHWPDGLQAALEAKEGVERQPDGRILGSITLQHFRAGLSTPVRHDRHGPDRRAGTARPVRARRGRRADSPADDPGRSPGHRLHPSGRQGARRRRRDPARPRVRTARAGRDAHRRRVGTARDAASRHRRGMRDSEREERCDGSARDRARRGAWRRHHLDEHGRPRHRHPAGRRGRGGHTTRSRRSAAST